MRRRLNVHTPTVKVCGLRPGSNMIAVVDLRPDYVGMIFVPSSPRYVTSGDISLPSGVADAVEVIGVFADAEASEIQKRVGESKLGGIQLHGDESPQFCREIRARLPDVLLIKAVSVARRDDVDAARKFEGVVDYILFDTKGKNRGGNGTTFDVDLLERYEGITPFWVAGGIGPHTVEIVLARCAQFPQFSGVDVNSAVEDAPGIKNVELVSQVLERVRI